MKYFVLIIAVVITPSAWAANKEPLIANEIIERAIRFSLKKPEGELTRIDLEKIRFINLGNTPIRNTNLQELTKLTKLTSLGLYNPNLIDSGLKNLTKLPQLASLYLCDTQVRKLAWCNFRKNCQNA